MLERDGNRYFINKADKNGKTPLMCAIARKNAPVIKLLLDDNADVNLADKNGKTALMYAILFEDIATITALLKNNAKVDPTDERGDTSLVMAIQRRNLEIINLLLKYNAQVNVVDRYKQSPLKLAIESKRIDIIKALIDKSGDVNIADITGRFPLIYAVEEGNLDVVKFLVNEGADTNAINRRGQSPLILSIENKRADITEFLLDKDVNVEVVDQYGKVPLMYAIENNDTALVAALLAKGANANKADSPSKTPLMYAIDCKNLDIIKLLFDKDQKVAEDNINLLVYALGCGDYDIAKPFLDRHLNMDGSDKEKSLHLNKIFHTIVKNYAMWGNPLFEKVINKLFKKGVDIYTDSNGERNLEKDSAIIWIREKCQRLNENHPLKKLYSNIIHNKNICSDSEAFEKYSNLRNTSNKISKSVSSDAIAIYLCEILIAGTTFIGSKSLPDQQSNAAKNYLLISKTAIGCLLGMGAIHIVSKIAKITCEKICMSYCNANSATENQQREI